MQRVHSLDSNNKKEKGKGIKKRSPNNLEFHLEGFSNLTSTVAGGGAHAEHGRLGHSASLNSTQNLSYFFWAVLVVCSHVSSQLV